MIADLIASVFHFGCACTTSAAVPATCGVAMDVPESIRLPVPVPMPVETMFTPGAETSGFSSESTVRGPDEVNDAVPVGIGAPFEMATVRPSRCTNSPPSLVAVDARPRTLKNGIVTVNWNPLSGSAVIGPSNGGSDVALLIMTTAAAPACWPKIARATRAQLPRCVTTSLPVTPAAMYSFGSQPRLTDPSALRSTFTSSDSEPNAAPFASI